MARVDDKRVVDLLTRYASGQDLDRSEMLAAGRGALKLLAARAPGRAVEVRVPYVGAVQIVGGPTHTRGTPPAVVEMDGGTWLDLATGRQSWDRAVSTGTVSASGVRADLSTLLPLIEGHHD